MSIRVAHVTIGLSRGIEARGANLPRLGGVLTDAVFDWADEQPGITGITWSLWPDTYPGLIVLSPYKLSPEQGDSLVKHIERRLWVASLRLHYSFRLGEVRLLILDDEYQTASTESTISTQNHRGCIPLEVGDTRLNTKAI
jgi:hypothetical protein